MRRIFKPLTFVLALGICFLLLVSCSNIDDYKGEPGKSAYELAVDNGYIGSLTEWLSQINGKDAASYTLDDIYDSAKENGYEGTFLEFIREYLSYGSTNYKNVNENLLSVVSIYTTFTKTVITNGWFGRPQTTQEIYQSAGSGVIYQLDKDNGNAYVMTNYHVIYDKDSNSANKISEKIELFLYGKEDNNYAMEAEYIGGSMVNDIAVVKVSNSDIIKGSNAVAAKIGDSNSVCVGETIYAIGNPQGEGIAVTSGIVSVDSEYLQMKAADEVTTVEFRVMRVDAAINGGNSGGGLFNEAGELIGIVNAKVVEDEIENIGYALPIAMAKALADNIVANCENKDSQQASKCVLGIKVNSNSTKAVYDSTKGVTRIVEEVKIESVEDNSVAFNKLAIGDILRTVTIKGTLYQISRLYQLSDLLLQCRASDIITFNILRNGVFLSVDVTLRATVLID